MAPKKSNNRIGTYLLEDLGKKGRLHKTTGPTKLPPSLNAYLVAVIFWISSGYRVADIGKGWVALEHAAADTLIVAGVSPRLVPKRFGPLLVLRTNYGKCYVAYFSSKTSRAPVKRRIKGR